MSRSSKKKNRDLEVLIRSDDDYYDKTMSSRRPTKEELEPTGGNVPIRRDLIERGGTSELGLEAPSGFEPLHRSFADCSLSHLGTAPRGKDYIGVNVLEARENRETLGSNSSP